MQPEPLDPYGPHELGGIIHLGDVRRRRELQRTRAPHRHYLGVCLFVAVTAWAGWALVLLTLPPARLLTYVAFFMPLWIALVFTGSAALYGLQAQRGRLPRLRDCARWGVELASVVVLNLAFQAAQRWTPLVAVFSLAIVVVVEIRTGKGRRAVFKD